jgi:hypothetical protein
MSGGTVTGTFHNNGVDSCPSYTSTISGTYSATASPQFTIYAQNPSVPAGTLCSNGTTITDYIAYSGSLQAGGCNSGSGSWSNSYPLTGSFTWSRACDRPLSENTYDSNAWGDSGLQPGQTNPTEHLWLAQVNAAGDFSGRTVGEQPGAAGRDACHDAAPDAGILEFASVTGGIWYINSTFGYNQYAYDGVGYTPDAVNAYRARGVEPCGTTFYQMMVIYCNDSTYIVYQTNNTLTATINSATSVSSGRGGLSATRVWP